MFPPCIKLILAGIQDGRKRSVFILTNYLTSIGWGYDKIEALLYEWNKKNPEPLREINLISQLRYHKQQQKKIMPPNCDNISYYKDFGVCQPDAFCARIKNPAQYSLLKARLAARDQKKGTRKLTEEEKQNRKQLMAERKKFKEEVKMKKAQGN